MTPADWRLVALALYLLALGIGMHWLLTWDAEEERS